MNDFKSNKAVRRLMSLSLAAILWGAIIAPAEARHDRRHEHDGQRHEQSDEGDGSRNQNQGEWNRPRISRKDAARRAQSQYGGRVLSVDEGEGPGYRVKILSGDGTVRVLDIDE